MNLAGVLSICALIMLPAFWWTVRGPKRGEHYAHGCLLMALGNLIAAAAGVVYRNWLLTAWTAALAAFWLWQWWRHRRRRDRARKTLGAKSRALLAALARRARKAAQPRRVLRPAPGGLRCS